MEALLGRNKRKASQAINILDRFHIVAKLNKAIDEVRADEYRKLLKSGYGFMLKHTRWLLLKRPENLTEKEGVRLRDIVRYNLKTIRAYLLKEDFQWFWEYVSPYWAGIFLDQWCNKVMRSKIEPMKKSLRQSVTIGNSFLTGFGQKAVFVWCGRRIKQQSEIDYQKILWL